jgi:chemotaxis protein CheZ
MPDASALPADRSLADRLASLRARYPQTDPDMVADVVRAVLSTMRGDLTATETALLAEVEELGQLIEAAKSEIAALRVDDITDSHIPSATDELDAIVQHTAGATHAILESCETLDAVADGIAGEVATRLQDATMRIYEACSFQDITGQRITKVVGTLKTIETKVAQIVDAFGERATPELRAAIAAPARDDLLNGPQLPTSAMDQSDIDRLLASFD